MVTVAPLHPWLAGVAALTAVACTMNWAPYDPRLSEEGGAAVDEGGAVGTGGHSGTGGGAIGSGGARSGCGDGVLDDGEICDDGNTEDGDDCSADCQIRYGEIFADDFEAGRGGWTHALLGGDPASSDNWSLSTARAHSGSQSWHSGPATPAEADTRLMSPPIDLTPYPAGTTITLVFWHDYQFDACNDADSAILEVDAGDGFAQVDPVDGYPDVREDYCATGAPEPPAWSGDTGGDFIKVSADLSGFAGAQIQLGFQVHFDCGNCAVEDGWYVDDVTVTATP